MSDLSSGDMSLHFQSAQSLWDFATQLYSHSEVEQCCLELQDQHNANVNIILWCCWLETEGVNLSMDVLEDVLSVVEALSQATVQPLRQVRRYIKSTDSFTTVQAKLINKHILNAELAVEKIILHRLQDLTQRFVKVMADAQNPLTLRKYLEVLGMTEFDRFEVVFQRHRKSL